MSDMIAEVGGKKFCVAADAVVIRDGKVLLILRNTPPYEGGWALPGGLADIGETLAETAKREAKEEAGVDVTVVQRVGLYDALGRDPSKRSIAAAFLCTTEDEPKPDGNETSDAKWFPLESLPALAFDHRKIIDDAASAI